jgi:arabinogalactan endo-1,4-beta-galactosidase
MLIAISSNISAVDISSLPEISISNPKFYNAQGLQNNFLDIVKEAGINTIRIRLWVNPVKGHSGFSEVKEFSESLKSKGFKTFSDFWDESYDEIEDNSDRMELVYKTIKSLIEKTNEEWDELNTKLLPILEHNRNTLITIKETEVNTTYINNLYNLFNDEPNTENFYLF